MDYNEREPIYLQIINDLKCQIALGSLKSDERLPSIKELSAQMKVNPNTMGRVYSELERQGIVFKEKGLGTFVTQDKDIIIELKQEMARQNVKTFVEHMYKIGFNDDDMHVLLAAYLRSRK